MRHAIFVNDFLCFVFDALDYGYQHEMCNMMLIYIYYVCIDYVIAAREGILKSKNESYDKYSFRIDIYYTMKLTLVLIFRIFILI